MNETSRIATSAIADMLAEMLVASQEIIILAVPALLSIIGVVAVGMFVIKMGKRIVNKAG
ncbi:hypothetical protein IGI86_001635 [Enterococcus sp. AZ188]|uniref:hypothetical protein n=1 Tax=unclassified Enterococcus TaxID=2608891 RepID=UPI003D2C7D58